MNRFGQTPCVAQSKGYIQSFVVKDTCERRLYNMRKYSLCIVSLIYVSMFLNYACNGFELLEVEAQISFFLSRLLTDFI